MEERWENPNGREMGESKWKRDGIIQTEERWENPNGREMGESKWKRDGDNICSLIYTVFAGSWSIL